jgi:hypothetical protein
MQSCTLPAKFAYSLKIQVSSAQNNGLGIFHVGEKFPIQGRLDRVYVVELMKPEIGDLNQVAFVQ